MGSLGHDVRSRDFLFLHSSWKLVERKFAFVLVFVWLVMWGVMVSFA